MSSKSGNNGKWAPRRVVMAERHQSSIRRRSSFVAKAADTVMNRRVSLLSGTADAEDPHLDPLTQYAAFMPRKLLPQLPSMAIAASPTATCKEIHGVVSFLDLAGFTKLTERLAVQVACQPDGAERLAKIVNKLMGQLLDTLKTGDTIKFSGDAICVLYEPDRSLMKKEAPPPVAGDSVGLGFIDGTGCGEEQYDDLQAMQDAAYRAVSEGLEALFDDYTVPASELGDFGDPDDPAAKDGISLALHVAVTAGRMQFTNMGGVFGRWEVLLAGPAMQALGPTADRAPTDWCTVHPECWALLDGLAGGNPFMGQHMGPGPDRCAEFSSPEDQGFVRVLLEPSKVKCSSETLKAAFSGSLKDYKYPKDPKKVALELKEWGATMDMAHHFFGKEAVADMHPETLAVLRRYVEPLIKQAIAASALAAISCFTDVSVLFLGISDVDLGAQHPTERGALWGQLIMQTTQECVYDHEGAINKSVMDDKGALMLCAWGLPPLSHADDPHRATSAALELAAALKELGAKARIGVTTGKVFAGVIGPSYRCEFSMLGDAVNLAARLMGKASFGGVLCDEPTYESAETSGSEFEVLKPVKVKGKEALIPIFRPLWQEEEGLGADAPSPMAMLKPGQMKRKKSLRRAQDNFASGASVLGTATHIRSEERAKLTGILGGFFSGQVGGGVLLLAGDAGSGKSELAKLVPKSAKEHGVRLIESKTPKTKAAVSEVQSSPCLEMSQLLRSLLSPDEPAPPSSPPSTPQAAAQCPKEEKSPSSPSSPSSPPASPALPPGPTSTEEWQERIEVALKHRPELVAEAARLFDGYYREWCGLPPAAQEADASGSNGSSGGDRRPSAAAAEAESFGDSAEAVARREVLGAVLDGVLSTQPLLLFVHVRTGSSLSANAVHPEMWPLLQWLSSFAASRNGSPCASGTHPLAVVFVNRRILDSGGQRQNEAVAAVVADAKKCRGLLQLDPLDEHDRNNYLCLSLKVAQVPPEVSHWVSDMANGNPQYTEICAKAVEKAGVVALVPPQGGGLPTAELKPGASLDKLEPPPKIAGFIRSTLGALGPEERLVTLLIALFPSSDPRLPPRPTKDVLRLSYETVAPMEEDRMDEVLGRLLLYGIIEEKPAPPKGRGGGGAQAGEMEEVGGEDSSDEPSYELIWPLMKSIAGTMLLKKQKEAILVSNAKARGRRAASARKSVWENVCGMLFAKPARDAAAAKSGAKKNAGAAVELASPKSPAEVAAALSEDEQAAAASAFFGGSVSTEWLAFAKKSLTGTPADKGRFENALRSEFTLDEMPGLFGATSASSGALQGTLQSPTAELDSSKGTRI